MVRTFLTLSLFFTFIFSASAETLNFKFFPQKSQNFPSCAPFKIWESELRPGTHVWSHSEGHTQQHRLASVYGTVKAVYLELKVDTAHQIEEVQLIFADSQKDLEEALESDSYSSLKEGVCVKMPEPKNGDFLTLRFRDKNRNGIPKDFMEVSVNSNDLLFFEFRSLYPLKPFKENKHPYYNEVKRSGGLHVPRIK